MEEKGERLFGFGKGLKVDAPSDGTDEKRRRIQIVSPRNDEQGVELVLRYRPEGSSKHHAAASSLFSVFPFSSTCDSIAECRSDSANLACEDNLAEMRRRDRPRLEGPEFLQIDAPSSSCRCRRDTKMLQREGLVEMNPNDQPSFEGCQSPQLDAPSLSHHDTRVLEETNVDFVITSPLDHMREYSSLSPESTESDGCTNSQENSYDDEASSCLSDEELKEMFQLIHDRFDSQSFSSSDASDDGLSGELQAIMELETELREELENISMATDSVEDIMTSPSQETRSLDQIVPLKVETTTLLKSFQRAMEAVLCCGITYGSDVCKSEAKVPKADINELLQQKDEHKGQDKTESVLLSNDVVAPSSLKLRNCECKHGNNPKFSDEENPVPERVVSNKVASGLKGAFHDLIMSTSPSAVGVPFTAFIWNVVLADYMAALECPSAVMSRNYWQAALHNAGKVILRFHKTYSLEYAEAGGSPTQSSNVSKERKPTENVSDEELAFASSPDIEEIDSMMYKDEGKVDLDSLQGKESIATSSPISDQSDGHAEIITDELLNKETSELPLYDDGTHPERDATEYNSCELEKPQTRANEHPVTVALPNNIDIPTGENDQRPIYVSGQNNGSRELVTRHCEGTKSFKFTAAVNPRTEGASQMTRYSSGFFPQMDEPAGSPTLFCHTFESVFFCGFQIEPFITSTSHQAALRDASFDQNFSHNFHYTKHMLGGSEELDDSEESMDEPFPSLTLSNCEYKLLKLYEINTNSTSFISRINLQFPSVVRGACHDFLIIMAPFSFGVPFHTYVWNVALADCMAVFEKHRTDFWKSYRRHWRAVFQYAGKEILRHHQVRSPKLLLLAGCAEPFSTIFDSHDMSQSAVKLSMDKDNDLQEAKNGLQEDEPSQSRDLVDIMQPKLNPASKSKRGGSGIIGAATHEIEDCRTEDDLTPQILGSKNGLQGQLQHSIRNRSCPNANGNSSIEEFQTENKITLSPYSKGIREAPEKGIHAEFGNPIENILEIRNSEITTNAVPSPAIESQKEFDFAFQSWSSGSATSDDDFDQPFTREPRPEDDSVFELEGNWYPTSPVNDAHSESSDLFEFSAGDVATKKVVVAVTPIALGAKVNSKTTICRRVATSKAGEQEATSINTTKERAHLAFDGSSGAILSGSTSTLFQSRSINQEQWKSEAQEDCTTESSAALCDLKEKEALLTDMLLAVRKVKHTAVLSHKHTIGIVGFGSLGQNIARTFQKYGRVVVISCSECKEKANAMGITYVPLSDPTAFFQQGVDVVVLAVSIICFAPTLVKLLPYIENELWRRARKGAKGNLLFADVLSTKEHAREVMLELLPPECDILCMHPMFDCASHTNGWHGLKFVYERTRMNGIIFDPTSGSENCSQSRKWVLEDCNVDTEPLDHLEWFLSIWEEEGCKMIPMSCREHDSHSMHPQFIVQLLGYIVGTLELEPTPIDTDEVSWMRRLVGAMPGNSLEKLHGLYKSNPESKRTITKLKQALDNVSRALESFEPNEKHH